MISLCTQCLVLTGLSRHVVDFSLSLQPLTRPHPSPAGLGAHDAENGEHILQTHALPRGVTALVAPFVTRGVQLFQARQLPQVADGRASGGPLDLPPLLALPALQAQVQAPPIPPTPSSPVLFLSAHTIIHHQAPLRSPARSAPDFMCLIIKCTN